jgi:hypothetical protein
VKHASIVRSALVLCVIPLTFAVHGDPTNVETKPYHDGPVWDLDFVRPKTGMDDRYLRYLAEVWKPYQETMKRAGYIMDYKVIVTESHDPQDFSVILMTQFKDLATMEVNMAKIEAVGKKLPGAAESEYAERDHWRDMIGGRVGREIILESKDTRQPKS